jgi:phosphoglucosamine mutase
MLLFDGDATERYVDHLAGLARYGLSGLSIAIDCANGAAYKAAPRLFERLNAEVMLLAAEPDGTNINRGCGATHPEVLAGAAKGRIGLAFDGDADRLIAVDEAGAVANGDVIMAIIARHMKSQGRLTRDTVVTTVMSNLGFRKSMGEAGIELVETKVGDRYVMEGLLAHDAMFGGEQSGHIIFLEHGRTGDGLLTAVRLLDVIAGTGKTLRQLRAEAITEYPQVLVNIEVDRTADIESAGDLWDEVSQIESELGGEGRVLVRPSGTEPLLRVMVEAASLETATEYADRLIRIAAASLGKG